MVAGLVTRVADRATRLRRFLVPTVALNPVHPTPDRADATAEGTTTPATTARFPGAEDASRLRRSFRRRQEKGAPRLRFWLVLAWQTLRQRDIRPLSREMADPFEAHGLEYLPAHGVFTLAVNHASRRWTPRLLATVHAATLIGRPDLARHWLVIVGYREASLEGKPFLVRKFLVTMRRIFGWVYSRWLYNTLRLPMGNERASIQALRGWKKRARSQPCLVFPEGRGATTFEEVRPGSGHWLAALGGTVLPVSVWWEAEVGRWQIVFGPAMEWSHNHRLHDHQIGLEIAVSLPPEEAPLWQDSLADWEAAYAATPRDFQEAEV